MLPPLDPKATPYPVDPLITLSDFEKAISEEADEIAAAFGPEGLLVLLARRGLPGQVTFYEDESPYLQGAVVTHNHPFGGVLSRADATFSLDNDVGEMRVVHKNGIVDSLLRPDGGWPDLESVVWAVERGIRGFQDENARRASRREPIMNLRELDRFLFSDQREAFGRIGVTMRRSNIWG